jgi:hypothetical protein
MTETKQYAYSDIIAALLVAGITLSACKDDLPALLLSGVGGASSKR